MRHIVAGARVTASAPHRHLGQLALERPRRPPHVKGADDDKAEPAKRKIYDLVGPALDVGELYIYETIGFDCFAENGGLTANKVRDAWFQISEPPKPAPKQKGKPKPAAKPQEAKP